MVLNHKLTNIENMHSQGVSLKHLSMANLTKIVSVKTQFVYRCIFTYVCTVQLASKFTARIGKNTRFFARHLGLLTFDAQVSRSLAQETMLTSYAARDLYVLTRSPT